MHCSFHFYEVPLSRSFVRRVHTTFKEANEICSYKNKQGPPLFGMSPPLVSSAIIIKICILIVNAKAIYTLFPRITFHFITDQITISLVQQIPQCNIIALRKVRKIKNRQVETCRFFCLWATKKIFWAVFRMNSNSYINHGKSRVYHQFRRNCISSKQSFVYHHCEKKCNMRLMIYTFGDEMHACA